MKIRIWRRLSVRSGYEELYLIDLDRDSSCFDVSLERTILAI